MSFLTGSSLHIPATWPYELITFPALEYLKDHSCHVSEGNQMPDLSQCHEYNDNSQAFADWKGSSQPPYAKSGPPPYLRGHASRTSGSEG